MTAKQDRFVRSLARMRAVSLNDAITSLIDDAIAAAVRAGARLDVPDKPRPARGRGGKVPSAFSDRDDPGHIEGQAAITDPDQ